MPRLLTKDDMTGMFPPLVSPFDASEDLDLAAFRNEVDFYIGHKGFTGVCIGGSTGEGYALEAEEVGQLVDAAQDVAAGRVPVMAGIITTTTRKAIRSAKAAAAAGAQALMVTPPIAQSNREDDLYAYFATIHRETGLPIMTYNVVAGNPVTPGLMRRMAENQHETGLFGAKESVGSSLIWMTELLDTVADKIAITWAHDWMLYPGLAVGAVGSVSGAAAVMPQHCLELWDAVQAGDLPRARRLNQAITDVSNQITTLNWPAGVKAAINLQGRKVGKCRAPFYDVSEEQRERIAAALKRGEGALGI
ncbi:dihydrodipicolinate synthase family protein [Martelella soudanensis]|uniref:dihydrodipicolinate synthase family protein n=1 Tax=unclassified Martelella TaxID=2629616 RepID=UPI0015E02B73|nr:MULTISPECIES: dihydrodipicolinate synthase family protein [unclassified Martelella]